MAGAVHHQKNKPKNNMMKTKYLLLFLVGIVAFSQTKKTKPRRNEVKINAILVAAHKIPISYEHILNKRHSIGLDVFFDYDFYFKTNYKVIWYPETKYGLRGFYKYYFSNKNYAQGFFLKLMGGIGQYVSSENEVFEKGIFGVFLGYKFNMGNFLLEFHLDFINAYTFITDSLPILNIADSDIIGFSIGYRF